MLSHTWNISSDIDTVFQKKDDLTWIWLTMGQIPIQYDPHRANKKKFPMIQQVPYLIESSYKTVYYQTSQAGEELPHKAALLYSPANIWTQPSFNLTLLKSY